MLELDSNTLVAENVAAKWLLERGESVAKTYLLQRLPKQRRIERERERERERVRFRAREKAMNTKSDMNDTNELLRWVGFTSL